MRKLLVSLVAIAATVFATSCTNDFDELSAAGDTNVTFTVSTPEIATRAMYGDGDEATQLYYGVYVYNPDGKKYLKDISVWENPKLITNNTAEVSLQLVRGKKYEIIFWAQNPESAATIAWETQTMSYNPAAANQETYDAFWAAHTIEKVTGAMTETIELRRPFAQLNIGTSDKEAAEKAGLSVIASGVTVASLPTTMNLLTGATDAATAVTYTAAALPAAGDFPIVGYEYVSMNYVLVGADKKLVVVDFNYYENGNPTPYVVTYDNVPVQRNYRTNIYGKIYTDPTDFIVEIKPEFFEDPAANTVFHAFQHGGEATLTQDIEIEHPLVVKAGVKAVLNLNNFSIKNNVNNTDTDVIIVEEGAELTINGEGTIEAVSGNDGYAVIAKGVVIINGGTFKAGVDANGEANAVVYARDNGKVYVNGGTFPNENNSAFVLNKRDADRATAVIEARGGRYYKFNPANNAAENAGTNFCPEGYNVIVDGDWYEVMKVTIVSNEAELLAALANENTENIKFANDINLSTQFLNIEGVNATIWADGYKLITSAKSQNYSIYIFGGSDVVINDLVIEDRGGIQVYGVSKLEINNSTIKADFSKESRQIFYVAQNSEVTINGGEYSVLRTKCRYFYTTAGSTINVKSGNFWDNVRDAAELVNTTNAGDVIITGGTFTRTTTQTHEKMNPTNWVPAGYTVTKSGNTWTVTAE